MGGAWETEASGKFERYVWSLHTGGALDLKASNLATHETGSAEINPLLIGRA